MPAAGRAYLACMSWLLALLLLAVAAPLQAAESPGVASERAEVRLLSEVDAVAPGTPFRIGLHQRLSPGWHTYWRNPGDAGAATEIAVELPDGGTAGPIAWPAPARIPYGPLVNFGYLGEVLLTRVLTPAASLVPGQRYRVEVDATWLVCERLCIPEEGRFTLDLPVAAAAAPAAAQAERFAASMAALPRPLPFEVTVGFEGTQGRMRLEGDAVSPATVQDAFFFPDAPGVLDNAAAQMPRAGPGALELTLTRGPIGLPAMLEGVLVVTDRAGGRAAFTVAAAPGPLPAAIAATPVPGLARAVLLALLGGLILNLMPCVFPVLAMKAFALARLGGVERRAVRQHAGAYTLGVLVAFLAAGAALVSLRAAGSALGWGFQFSQPAFVAAMAWLMLLVALNLSGVFTIGRPVNAGSTLVARGGHFGSFATGVLAVLVATPCTAPFMAAALGAALALPATAALVVFAALGLGLAAPYALLALFPALARGLPRPGAWMLRLRQALAFPMYATAAWLTWVLAELAGSNALLAGLAGAVALAFGAWLFGLAQQGASRRLGLAALLPALAGLALLPGLAGTQAPTPAAGAPAAAEAWSEARLGALQAEGRSVFVNFTAAWCITCKVNERIALNRDAVRAAMQANQVAYLKGDWTQGDPAIGAALRRYGREGVPLYLLYPAGGGPPKILPEILTEAIVLDALAETRLSWAGPLR